jgi:ribonucleoside-diphosphate reductase alpha chain
MDSSLELMSKVTHYLKYAKYLESEKRRESWEENCHRTRDMHIRKYPFLREQLIEVFDKFIIPKKVVPAMRSMQFSGLPIELMESRLFNCAYMPMDHWKTFREVMFLLIGGTGVGYSVQYKHVNKLPSIRKPTRSKKYLIADDMIGWANAVEVLTKAYLDGGALPIFDYRSLRKKGTPLKTSGGKAPGPEPLKKTLTSMQAIFDSKDNGSKLTPIEVHDINCFIADAVLSGGIREAAMIALFSMEDQEMIRCKSNFNAKLIDETESNSDVHQVVVEVNGWMPAKQHTVFLDKKHYEMLVNEQKLPWFFFEPQRGRSNNSAVFVRDHHTELNFRGLYKQMRDSGAGEPGIYFTNDPELGTNPCVEISLKPNQFCNLTEVNISTVKTQEELEDRVKAAALLGTIQAGYTDFHYLRDIWKENTESEALLGVSLTGLASISNSQFDLVAAANAVKEENKRIAKIMGIKPAARTTCVKPSGTTSLVMGTSSGIHAWFDRYYVRRLKINKIEPLFGYLMSKVPELLEDSIFDPKNSSYLCIPMKAPDGSVTSDKETAFEFLERVKRVSVDWVKTGHISGPNTHNVSATVYVGPEEWDQVGAWMWENRNVYNGLSLLPKDGGTYQQAPFESVSEEKYLELSKYITDIDLTEVKENVDNTTVAQEIACSGGVCEIRAI